MSVGMLVKKQPSILGGRPGFLAELVLQRHFESFTGKYQFLLLSDRFGRPDTALRFLGPGIS